MIAVSPVIAVMKNLPLCRDEKPTIVAHMAIDSDGVIHSYR